MRPAQSASLRAVLHRGIGRHRRLSFEAPGKGKTTRAPRRAYATQNPHRNAAACKRGRPCVCHRNPHRNAAACKTRSPVRTPPEIRTETPLHAKRGRPCVRHPKSAQKHRCMQNSVARAGDRAAAESAETPANRNARASPEPPAGFCLRRLEKRRAFARAFRCADKSAPGMPRPCSPLRRFRLRVHCRT